ncbi:hypothetical protein FRB95_011383 [Tulasnella sp. JGI-2019a]|nr:hypothetical protein FRB93_001122 [Tulasnella sp. JGI-2019a]KAG9024524.1 hypothetical protein FRB95_011383 [Tulasnella sp. JGI-2019a]
MAPDSGFIYHVMRHTDDRHMGGEYTTLRGTHWTLKEANAAVRQDLIKEWSMDTFVEYEEEVDDDGIVEITATFPEGEIMRVYVDKKPAPKPKSKPPVNPAVKEHMAHPATTMIVEPLKAVWIVVQTDYQHHTDRKGRSHVVSDDAYDSLKAANEAAREALLETCGAEINSDDEYNEDSIEIGPEENRGSATKGYKGSVYVAEDDRDNVKVEVKRLTLHHSTSPVVVNLQKTDYKRKTAPIGSSPKPAKKKPRDDEVVVISSD